MTNPDPARHSSTPHAPSMDDDPVARRVDWRPLRPGGANFKTTDVRLRGNLLEVVPSLGMILFCASFGIPGLLGLAASASAFLSGKGPSFVLGALAFGTAFGLVTAVLLRRCRRVTFDKAAGIYYQGRQRGSGRAPADQGALAAIHALQLIAEPCSEHTSYEINLVCRDGSRVPVLDHGDRDAIERAAGQLAAYLGIPIWRRMK